MKQYEEIRKLKLELPVNHVACQMDFTGNYNCAQADKIQSAYFDKSIVTLHTVVKYFKDENGNLYHKSLVFVSLCSGCATVQQLCLPL